MSGYGSLGYGDGLYGGESDVHAVDWKFQIGDHQDDNGSFELSLATSRTVKLNLTSPSEASFQVPGWCPEAEHITELQTDVWCWRGEELMLRARVLKVNETLTATGGHTLTVSCLSYKGLLDYQFLPEDTTFTNEEQGAILRVLVGHALGQAGWALLGVLVDSAWPNTGVLRTMSFKEGDSILSCVNQLTGADSGMDFDITPRLVATLYWPQRGINRGSVLDFGGSIVDVTRVFDSGSFANSVIVTGDADSGSATRSVPSELMEGIGRWSARISDPDLIGSDTVARAADEALIARSQPVPQFTMTFARRMWSPIICTIGDVVLAVVKSGRLSDVYDVRVFSVAIDLDSTNEETVTVVTGSSKVDFRALLRGLSRNVQKALKR